MNRRGFLLGAGALAAPSIIGISGIIQLSRALVVPTAWYRVELQWADGFAHVAGEFRSTEEAIERMRRHIPPGEPATMNVWGPLS